jgi:cation diffusion facilitator family transporter
LLGLELENLGLGTSLTVLAVLINGALGGYLIWVGKRRKSIILTANGKHVLTDCWTSLGVVVGLCLALVTGWLPWDPIAAIAVALNILWSGFGLIRQSVGGLMDVADPEIHGRIIERLDRETQTLGVAYHRLRHRSLGDAYWVEVHLLFPSRCRSARRIGSPPRSSMRSLARSTGRATSRLTWSPARITTGCIHREVTRKTSGQRGGMMD